MASSIKVYPIAAFAKVSAFLHYTITDADECLYVNAGEEKEGQQVISHPY